MVKSVTAAQGSIKKRGARVDSAPAPPLTISSSTRGSLEIVIIDPATYAKNKDSVAAAFKEACGVPESFHAQVDVNYSLDSDVKRVLAVVMKNWTVASRAATFQTLFEALVAMLLCPSIYESAS